MTAGAAPPVCEEAAYGTDDYVRCYPIDTVSSNHRYFSKTAQQREITAHKRERLFLKEYKSIGSSRRAHGDRQIAHSITVVSDTVKRAYTHIVLTHIKQHKKSEKLSY